MHEENTSKKQFWMGVGATVIIGFVVGFFILLAMVLGGEEGSSNKAANNGNNAAAVAGTGNTGASDIRVAAVTDQDWVKGDRNAEISIIEFSDTECPFCKRFHETMDQVVAQYDGKVNWVYRHFPLASLHAKAQKEAEATECAGELGGNEGFWAYTDRLFEITPSNDGLDEDQLPEIAEYAGLNKSSFEECLSSGRHASKVRDDLSDGSDAGARGTPYSVVITKDGQTIPLSGAQPFSSVSALIDQLL